MKKLLANQIFTTKILWGALLSSNLIFGFLVYSKLIVGPEYATSDILHYIPYALGIGAMSMSLVFYSKATNFEDFKRKFNSSAFNKRVEDFTPQAQTADQYEALDHTEKKQFHILQQSFILFILTWAMAEATNIMGIVGIFLGMNPEHYWYFFTVGVGLMFYTFPKQLSSRLKSLR